MSTMEKQSKKPRAPREGFRRRINPYYGGMNKRQIAEDIAKTTGKWLLGTVVGFIYWFFMLLIISVFLLNVWKVSFEQILIYSAILGVLTSLIYGYTLIHRKLYY